MKSAYFTHYQATSKRHPVTGNRTYSHQAIDTVLYYTADVLSATDYYPFGSPMPGRSLEGDGYRFGFQGQEMDDEVKGSGNSINYKYRIHDPRLGRFLSIDPLTKEYPWNSPYAFSENKVISSIEFEGLEAWEPKFNAKDVMSLRDFQGFYKSMLDKCISKDIDAIGDCADFQFYILAKYYESKNVELSFNGLNGVIINSSDPKYKETGFEGFFKDARPNVSTFTLTNPTTFKQTVPISENEMNMGDIFAYFSSDRNRGHSMGFVKKDDKTTTTLYDTGSEDNPEIKIFDFDNNARYLQGFDHYRWSSLSNLPKDLIIEKAKVQKIDVIKIETTFQPGHSVNSINITK